MFLVEGIDVVKRGKLVFLVEGIDVVKRSKLVFLVEGIDVVKRCGGGSPLRAEEGTPQSRENGPDDQLVLGR